MYKRATHLFDLDLPGCEEETYDLGNYSTLLDSLTLRLALYCTRNRAYIMQNVIDIESEHVNVVKTEYVLNEIQYEFRKAARFGRDDNGKEEEVFKQWFNHLEPIMEVDDILEFYKQLVEFRAKRVL